MVLGSLFSFGEIAGFGAAAALLSGAALYALPWARQRGRFAVGAASTFVGCVAWNLVLSENDAASLDIDAPVIPFSWQDVGSGVATFLFAALTLSVLDRREPAGQVVGAAVLAGLVATVFDLFAL
ncbi:MAG TPA: hypothetical protein VK279_09855 [Solirubrobacteraceae bacterium]|nr:hypothetical protein [Solirubrobacteraceae bacterium]